MANKQEESDPVKEVITEALSTVTSKVSVGAADMIMRAASQLIGHVQHRIDPYGQSAFKKKAIEQVQNMSLEIHKAALDKYRDKAVEGFPGTTKEAVLNETLKLMSSSVFTHFIENIEEIPHIHRNEKSKRHDKFHSSEAWWDQFCSFMRNRQEEWRSRLLAEAMKVELTEPGAISFTTLWKIVSLPTHAWVDLTEFRSLAGEIWVNEAYFCTCIMGSYSLVEGTEYQSTYGRRLIKDLSESLQEDGLIFSETGPLILDRSLNNEFRIGDKRFKISVPDDYVDEEMKDEPEYELLKDKIRLFGVLPTYVTEEIFQLASKIDIHPQAMDIFKSASTRMHDEDFVMVDQIELTETHEPTN